jgi:hypothetical protein
MSFFIVSHFDFLILVNKNNPFYGLLGFATIGVIPITSLSKLFVAVKPGFGDEFSSIGLKNGTSFRDLRSKSDSHTVAFEGT